MRHTHTILVAAMVAVLAVPLTVYGNPNPTSDAKFQAEWKKLIAAAKQEGRLVVNLCCRASFRSVFERFGKKFGIRVTISVGSGREQADRMLAEQRVGRFEVDLGQGGETTINTRLVPANALEPIPPLLFHPEVVDTSLWYGGKHWYTDIYGKYNFVFGAEVNDGGVSTIWWNTKAITLDEVRSWKSPWDLVSDRYRGKIIARDPLTPGASQGILLEKLNPQMGEKWMRRFYGDPELDVFWTNDGSYITAAISKGGRPLGFNMGSTELADIRDLGGPVMDFSTLQQKEGLPSIGGHPHLTGNTSTNIWVGRNPPHKNAVKLFLNWLFSREGQTVMHLTPSASAVNPTDVHDFITLREDVTEWGLTDPQYRRKPGVKYGTPRMDPKMRPKFEEAWEWMKEIHRKGYRR